MTIKNIKKEDFNIAKNLYINKNYSILKISKILGISYKSIYRNFKRDNIKIKNLKEIMNNNDLKKELSRRKTGFTDKEELEICNLYNKGKSSCIISKLYNIGYSTVLSILKRNNIIIRSFSESAKIAMKNPERKYKNHITLRKFTDKKELEICNLYKKKKSSREISKLIDCNHLTIINILKRNNIKIRNRSFAIKIALNKPQTRINLSKGIKKALNNLISRQKLSKASKGKNNPMFGRKCPNSKGAYYKNIWMRSSWEITYAKWLDKMGYHWKYEPKRFYFKNKDFTYLPDFWVNELNSYIEIKGFWRNPIDKEKVKLLKEKNNLILIEDIKPYEEI